MRQRVLCTQERIFSWFLQQMKNSPIDTHFKTGHFLAAAGLGLHSLHMSEGPFSHDAGQIILNCVTLVKQCRNLQNCDVICKNLPHGERYSFILDQLFSHVFNCIDGYHGTGSNKMFAVEAHERQIS